MPVSAALEESARKFNTKYTSEFSFQAFETRVEEFTFLRPNSGWIEVYKDTFEGLYKRSLEKAAEGSLSNLSGEVMLDDFEYMLIRPYVNEGENEIKHKPYVGMDRITRLEYVNLITASAPKNSVELFAQKYKSGRLTLRQIKSAMNFKNANREEFVRLSAYIEAIESISKSRSAWWRAFHPFKSSAEKREAALMKSELSENMRDGENFYREILAAAYETFDGYKMATANLLQSINNAKEEKLRLEKMSNAIRKSLPRKILEAEHDTALRIER